MNIRLASPGDIPFMISMEHASAEAGHWTEAQYHDAVQRSDGAERLVLVIEGSSGILGFLVALHVASEWELENIVIAPAERRIGLGRRLLEALLALAREAKSESVFLEVRESNAAARSLYEKAGFQQTGRRPAYYSNPSEDAVLYRLDLA